MNKHSKLFVLIVMLVVGYVLGYLESPGPYLPAEDSVDYINHHCVVKKVAP